VLIVAGRLGGLLGMTIHGDSRSRPQRAFANPAAWMVPPRACLLAEASSFSCASKRPPPPPPFNKPTEPDRDRTRMTTRALLGNFRMLTAVV